MSRTIFGREWQEQQEGNTNLSKCWNNECCSVLQKLKRRMKSSLSASQPPSSMSPHLTCTVICGTWGQDMSREWITLTKYVGCTCGLVLFRATELELDSKSKESKHWLSSLFCVNLEMLQGQVVWRESKALLRAALPSQGSPVLAYTSCCWSLPSNDHFGIRIFVTAVLTTVGLLELHCLHCISSAAPRDHGRHRISSALQRWWEQKMCVAYIHYFKGEFPLPTLPSRHFVKEGIGLYFS